MMEYGGYVARVEYDDSVELLHGSVVNSGPYPIATCEAADVQTFKDEFNVSVDEYLCAWASLSLFVVEIVTRVIQSEVMQSGEIAKPCRRFPAQSVPIKS